MIPLGSNEPQLGSNEPQLGSNEPQSAGPMGQVASSEEQVAASEAQPRLVQRPVLIWRLVLALPTAASKRLAGQGWLANPEHTSLEQRLGALQGVRMAIVALAVVAAAAVPHQLGMTVGQVLPLSLGYLAVCLASQAMDHRRLARSRSLGVASLGAVGVHTSGQRRRTPAHAGLAPTLGPAKPSGGGREERRRPGRPAGGGTAPRRGGARQR